MWNEILNGKLRWRALEKSIENEEHFVPNRGEKEVR